MIKTSDFLFEMGLSLEDLKEYREYLFESVGSKESFNLQYRAAVLGNYIQEAVKIYGDYFIDIFKCTGYRYAIFEKDSEGFYKINVKTFVVKPTKITHPDCEKTSICGWKFSTP